jgi:hypothetical protein
VRRPNSDVSHRGGGALGQRSWQAVMLAPVVDWHAARHSVARAAPRPALTGTVSTFPSVDHVPVARVSAGGKDSVTGPPVRSGSLGDPIESEEVG